MGDVHAPPRPSKLQQEQLTLLAHERSMKLKWTGIFFSTLIFFGAMLQLFGITAMVSILRRFTFNGNHFFSNDLFLFLTVGVLTFVLSVIQLAAFAFQRKSNIYQKSLKLTPILLLITVLQIFQLSEDRGSDLNLMILLLCLPLVIVFFLIQEDWLKSNSQQKPKFIQSIDPSLIKPLAAIFLAPVFLFFSSILYIYLNNFILKWMIEFSLHKQYREAAYAIAFIPPAIFLSLMFFFISRRLYEKYAAVLQFLLVAGTALLLTLIGYDLTYIGFSTSFLAAGFVLWVKYVFARRKFSPA